MGESTSSLVFKWPYAIAMGAVLGLLGAAPLLLVLAKAVKAKQDKAKAPSVLIGFAAVVTSFLIGTIEIFLVYSYLANNFVEIATATVLFMLLIVFIAGIAAWHTMDTAHRND